MLRRPAPELRVRAVIALVATLAVVGVGTLPVRAGGPPPSNLIQVTLQLKWLPQAQFAGYFVAQDLGFYRQQGLNVTILPGGPTIEPEKVVTSGRADIGIDWLSALLVARDRGADITNIAQIFQATGMRLITFKSSGIHSIPQFRGKRVGIWFAGNQYQFLALMHHYGMSPPQKYMTVVPQGFNVNQFLTHKVDVATVMTYNELGQVYEHGIKPSQLTYFDYNKLGVTVLEDGLFARVAWLRAHASVATRFLRASIEGWRWAVAHPDRAGMISYRHERPGYSSPAHQRYMARQVARLIRYGLDGHTIGYMAPARYARTWHILLSEHVIGHAPSGAYTQQYFHSAGGH